MTEVAVSNRTKNFLVLSVALAVALGAGEGVLRIRNSRSIRIQGRHGLPPFRRPHPVYHHALRPGALGYNTRKGEFRVAFRINSLGMRDREYSAGKPVGKIRILMLGDSFTEGYSVELADTFVKRLERRLNASPPRKGARYEVANLGVAGFSPLLEYLRLKEILPRLPGDFVLLNLDPGDFADDHSYQQGATWAPNGTPLAVRREGLLPAHLSYGRHFLETLPSPPWRDVYLLRYLVWHFIRRTHKSWVKNRLGNITYDSYGWTRPGQESNEAWGQALERTFGHILRIRDVAQEAGMGFALAAYPIGHMVHPEAWCAGRQRGFYECGKVYRGSLFERLIARCAKAGITCWDLTPAFTRPDAPKLFFEVDGHFTISGNILMAEELEKRLRPLLAAR